MSGHLKLGDCYQISLGDRGYAYCQYLQWSDRLGCLIRVFDRISKTPLTTEELQRCGGLFPPVFVGLRASVKSGRWKRIGWFPVEPFQFPRFRCTSATKPGTYKNWWLWEGGEQRFIGKLPSNLRNLEVEVVWGDELLEERIATGKNLFDQIR